MANFSPIWRKIKTIVPELGLKDTFEIFQLLESLPSEHILDDERKVIEEKLKYPIYKTDSELSKIETVADLNFHCEAEKDNKFFDDIFSEWLLKRDDIEALKREIEITDDKNEKLEKPRDTTNIFPCVEGTTWNQIFITLIDNEVAKIKTPIGEGRFTYHELGMSDKRSGNRPTLLWGLFKLFAKNQGFISSNVEQLDPKIVDTAKRLNGHLKGLFGIEESIYDGTYRKLKKVGKEKDIEKDIPSAEKALRSKGYKTKIIFSDQRIVIS